MASEQKGTITFVTDTRTHLWLHFADIRETIVCPSTLSQANDAPQRQIDRSVAGLMPLVGLVYAIIRVGGDITSVVGIGAWLSIFIGLVLFVVACVKTKA